jgi:hypothetical protein
MLWQLSERRSRRTLLHAALFLLPSAFPLCVWMAYFHITGQQSLSPYAIIGTAVGSSVTCLLKLGSNVVEEHHARPAVQAARQARKRLAGMNDLQLLSTTKRYSFQGRLTTLRKILKGTLPCLLGIAVVTAYVYGVFIAYRAAEHHLLKSFVYVCALIVKMAGNKLQLVLIGQLRFMRSDTVDEIVFVYEYVTCLLCRVMLLSMPNDQTATVLSVHTFTTTQARVRTPAPQGRAHARTRVRTHARTHTHARACAHTHIHTHTHTLRRC